MREVRWFAQARRKDGGDWFTREDVTYSGWFHSTGEDEPSDSLMRDFEEAKANQDWLEWRLVQENRSHTRKVIAGGDNVP